MPTPAYNLPAWLSGAAISLANLNRINNTLDYLHVPPYVNVREDSGTYVTSSTSPVNVGVNFTVTIDTEGGHILIGVGGLLKINTPSAYVEYLGLSLDGSFVKLFSTDIGRAFDKTHLWVAPAAGSHTIALQYYVNNASAIATLDKADTPLYLWALEL